MRKKSKKSNNLFAILVIVILAILGYFYVDEEYQIGDFPENIAENIVEDLAETENTIENISNTNSISYETSNIPEYNGEIYITLDNNIPNFSDEDFALEEAYYSELVNGRVRNGYDKNQLGKGK